MGEKHGSLAALHTAESQGVKGPGEVSRVEGGEAVLRGLLRRYRMEGLALASVAGAMPNLRLTLSFGIK